MNKGTLVIVSGPSGVGKGTVLKSFLNDNKNVFYSVSATTRKPRDGETDGVEYYFIEKEQFESLIANDKMLEYAEYCGNYYGTPKDPIDQNRELGKTVILEIELCGARQVIDQCPDAVTVFIAPPSMEELRRRLMGRGTEEPKVVEKRLKRAEEEMKLSEYFQHTVVNDTVETAKEELSQIIKNK